MTFHVMSQHCNQPTEEVSMGLVTDSSQQPNATVSVELTTAELPISTTADANAPLFIMKKISGDIPEFEIILPCIFGIFIILSLGLMVFYTKSPSEHKTKVMEQKYEEDKEPDSKTDSSWF